MLLCLCLGSENRVGACVLMCCSAACRKVLRTVNSVVTRARMFTAKPDGDVNIFMLQVGPAPRSTLCSSASTRGCLQHGVCRMYPSSRPASANA